jgi:hypothetical protein
LRSQAWLLFGWHCTDKNGIIAALSGNKICVPAAAERSLVGAAEAAAQAAKLDPADERLRPRAQMLLARQTETTNCWKSMTL